MSANGLLDAIHAHLGAASSAPEPIALLHLAQARNLLTRHEQDVAAARTSLEAMEREMVRRASALVVAVPK